MLAKAKFDALRSLGFASISGSYADIGDPFEAPVRALFIANATDGDMFISLDGGVTDHLFMLAGTFQLYDVGANVQPADDKYVLPVGTQCSVKQSTAPTQKGVYISALR